MAFNKLLPATLVLLALLGAAGTAQAACRATGSMELMGSTTNAQTLNHYSTSASDRMTGQECQWMISCPAGSYLGATAFDFNIWTGDSVKFSQVAADGSWTAKDTWSSASSLVYSGSSYSDRKFLYPGANKVAVQYNTTASGTVGYGFQMDYQCFTSTCPPQLVNKATYNTAARSGFSLTTDAVPGTACEFSFTCSNTADRPWFNAYKGSNANRGWTLNVGGRYITSSNTSSTHTAVQLDAAASYTVKYEGPASATSGHDSSSTYYYRQIAFWAGCQAATETTCKTGLYRNGATLSDGFGLIAHDTDGQVTSTSYGSGNKVSTYGTDSCEYHVTCPSGSTGIDFKGYSYVSSYSTTGSAKILATAGASTALSSFTTSTSTYTATGTSAYVELKQLTTGSWSGAWVQYSCRSAQCYSSAQSGLHMQTRTVTNTALKPNTLFPVLADTQDFHSDADGTSSSSRLTTSTQSGQRCQFTFDCPAGYYVMLNVTGRLVSQSSGAVDQIYATAAGGKVYDYAWRSSASYTTYTILGNQPFLTSVNSLTWTQSAHYYSYGYGYTVTGQCTTLMEGSCPWAENHFSNMSTVGSVGIAHTLQTYTTSSIRNLPIGAKCAFPITCPAGYTVQLQLTNGFGNTATDAPSIKDGTTVVTIPASTTTWNTGLNSLTIDWDSKTFNGTSSYADLYKRGFDVTATCGVYATPVPTSAQCSASPQAALHGTNVAITSTTAATNTLIEMTAATEVFKSDADGKSSSYKLTSAQDGQLCEFGVTCPTGYYVMLNVSGEFMYNKDRIYATTASSTYDLTWYSSFTSDKTMSYDYSQVTDANALTWTQAAHYGGSTFYGRGYNVEASCTKTKAGTCPWSTAGSHFSALATATVGTSVTLNTYSASSAWMYPGGLECSYPITCPSGSYVKLQLLNGMGTLSSYSGTFSSYSGSATYQQPMSVLKSGGTKIAMGTYSNGYMFTYENSVTVKWNSVWNGSSTSMMRGLNFVASCDTTVQTPNPTPVPYSGGGITIGIGGSSSSSKSNSSNSGSGSSTTSYTVGACHYAQTSWTLAAGVRNRLIFDFSSNTGLTECNFAIKCPAPAYGIVMRATDTHPSGTILLAKVNTSSTIVSSILGGTYLSSTSGVVVSGKGQGIQMSVLGNGGFVAIQASCLETPDVPAKGSDINRMTSYYYSSTSWTSTISTYSTSYTKFTADAEVAVETRRSYGENEQRAFVVSCYSADQTTSNTVVNLYRVYGYAGTDDRLEVTALDSNMNKTYTGNGSTYINVYTNNGTSTATNDTASFSASSQYWINWKSGSSSESLTGLTVSYRCVNASWPGISGVGEDVAADAGAGAALLSTAAAAIFTVLAVVANV